MRGGTGSVWDSVSGVWGYAVLCAYATWAVCEAALTLYAPTPKMCAPVLSEVYKADLVECKPTPKACTLT